MINKALIFFFLISLFVFPPKSFAALPSPSQQASGQEGLNEEQDRERRLREKVEQPLPKLQEAPAQENQQPPAVGNEKTLITVIHVTGNTILPAAQIDKIIAPFRNTEMAVSDMQKVADLITDAYRKKGFITTRAIIPPQKVQDNTLELKIIVGLMGDVDVKGNHYFKKRLFTNRITIKNGQPFNYNALRSDLFNINQYPDRTVKAVITPGQTPGETDVLLNVNDRMPLHVGFSFDDFGSIYLGKYRYLGSVTDDNLLGLDDILTFQYQESGVHDAYRLESFRYLLPVTTNTQLGFYSTRNQYQLQEQFKDVDARGKSEVYGGFVNQTLYNQPDLKIVADLGFDYKDVYNFLLGSESSRDIERLAKSGINVDYTDILMGRNILNDEIDNGIPDIMGGAKAVDSHSSVSGSGGKFSKDVLDYLRLQNLPFDSTLLVKGEAQFTSRTLDATEQYQLGGIGNVRGFAPGDAVGDSGQTATAEFGLPVYGLPKNLNIPFTSDNLYSALRLAAFYDWGRVSYRDAQPGVAKSTILDSFGCGARLTLPQDFFFRIDLAWPVDGEPADGHHEHTWMQVTKQF